MTMLADISLTATIVLFVTSAGLIAYCGARLTALADRLADVTGLGEAVAGGLLLGATTSLPGIVTSVAAARDGLPELAVSNALGGIAAQTVFLAAADVSYPGVNLEHAAASTPNVMQGILLIVILSIALLTMNSPEVSVLGIHPVTPLIVLTYIYGLHMVRESHHYPMWRPRMTRETRLDEPRRESFQGSLSAVWLRFGALAALLVLFGWLVLLSAMAILRKTGLPETIVGGLFTAVATSLPELVTSLAAVRQGALTLAVSGVLGGNAFDTLFLAMADVAYREGSIYHAITQRQSFLLTLTILMTAILLMGLVRREKRGFANIGFESCAITVLYVGAFAILIVYS